MEALSEEGSDRACSMLPSEPEISSGDSLTVLCGGRAADWSSDSDEWEESSLSWPGAGASVKPAIIGFRWTRSNWARERSDGRRSLAVVAAVAFSS